MSLNLKSLSSNNEPPESILSLDGDLISVELSALKNIIKSSTNTNKLDDLSVSVKSMVIVDDSSKLI